MPRVDPQPQVRLDRAVEFRGRALQHQPHRIIGRVLLGALDRLGGFLVFLATRLRHQAVASLPSDRAVPSIIFIAAATSWAFRSLRLSSAIARTCCLLTLLTLILSGLAHPL